MGNGLLNSAHKYRKDFLIETGKQIYEALNKSSNPVVYEEIRKRFLTDFLVEKFEYLTLGEMLDSIKLVMHNNYDSNIEIIDCFNNAMDKKEERYFQYCEKIGKYEASQIIKKIRENAS